MSEDPTQSLPSSFEEKVLAEFAAIRQELATQRGMITQLDTRLTSLEGRMTSLEDRMTSLEDRMTSLEGKATSLEGRVISLEGRMTSLEEKVDARMRETRPIWEGVQARLVGIEAELKTLNRQFRSYVADMFQLRVRVETLEEGQPTT